LADVIELKVLSGSHEIREAKTDEDFGLVALFPSPVYDSNQPIFDMMFGISQRLCLS